MIFATYSSSLFETEDKYFETVSIDLKRDDEKVYEAIVLFRHVEKQCVGFDGDNNFLLTPDEWSYVDENLHQLHAISRRAITKRINEITTWAVQKYDVDDVRRGKQDVATARKELDIPFNTEHSFDNLLDHKEFEKFTDTLERSFGESLSQSFISFFAKTFKELPKPIVVEENKVPYRVGSEYVSWGDWA